MSTAAVASAPLAVSSPLPSDRPGLEEHLALWEQLCADPRFSDLPYKVETDRHHRLLMSPVKNQHSYWQTGIAHLLRVLLPHGKVLVECAVVTTDGVKVPDVGWFTMERFKIILPESACSVAPQIAVETLSVSNTRREIASKRALYFARGAEAFWLCDVEGRLTFFTPAGPVERSPLCPEFPAALD